MNVVFPMMMIQLIFLVFLYCDKKLLQWFFLGSLCGYSFLTLNSTLFLFFVIIIYILYKFIIKNLEIYKFSKFIIFFILGFSIIILPWGIITYQYFGKIFYSNLNFYPYTPYFSNMMHESSPPSLTNYLNSVSFLELFKKYFFWTLKDIYQGSLYLVPSVFFSISIFMTPLILLNSFYNKFKVNIFFSCTYFDLFSNCSWK